MSLPASTPTSGPRAIYTLLGLLVLPIWASTLGVARSAEERLGGLALPALFFTIAGVIGCGVLLFRPAEWRRVREVPRRFWAVAGTCFVLYQVLLYMALVLSPDREATLEVGLINYLWPALTLALSIPILGRRAGIWLWPGVAMAFAGIAIAQLGLDASRWQEVGRHLVGNVVPCLLAAAAAVAWALYSNFTRRLIVGTPANTTPVVLLATGAALGLLWLVMPHAKTSNAGAHGLARPVFELFYLALVPSLLGNSLWDLAMRRGDSVVVAAASQFGPLLSTAVSALYLGVSVGRGLWVGCVLVTVGAVVCRFSVHERAEEAAGAPPAYSTASG